MAKVNIAKFYPSFVISQNILKYSVTHGGHAKTAKIDTELSYII